MLSGRQNKNQRWKGKTRIETWFRILVDIQDSTDTIHSRTLDRHICSDSYSLKLLDEESNLWFCDATVGFSTMGHLARHSISIHKTAQNKCNAKNKDPRKEKDKRKRQNKKTVISFRVLIKLLQNAQHGNEKARIVRPAHGGKGLERRQQRHR